MQSSGSPLSPHLFQSGLVPFVPGWHLTHPPTPLGCLSVCCLSEQSHCLLHLCHHQVLLSAAKPQPLPIGLASEPVFSSPLAPVTVLLVCMFRKAWPVPWTVFDSDFKSLAPMFPLDILSTLLSLLGPRPVNLQNCQLVQFAHPRFHGHTCSGGEKFIDPAAMVTRRCDLGSFCPCR